MKHLFTFLLISLFLSCKKDNEETIYLRTARENPTGNAGYCINLSFHTYMSSYTKYGDNEWQLLVKKDSTALNNICSNLILNTLPNDTTIIHNNVDTTYACGLNTIRHDSLIVTSSYVYSWQLH